MATTSKSPSLSSGEYKKKGTLDDLNLWNARFQVLRAIERVYPVMLKRLASDVLPAIDSKGEYPSLASALNKWCADFHVSEAWLRDTATRTVRAWYVGPKPRKQLQFEPPSEGGLLCWNTVKAPDFVFDCAGWELELCTWAQYKQFVHAEVEKTLAAYEKMARELARLLRLVPSQKKYSLNNIEWFVCYQFTGMPYKEIADGYHGEKFDESAIRKGIQAAAKLIGWDRLRKIR